MLTGYLVGDDVGGERMVVDGRVAGIWYAQNRAPQVGLFPFLAGASLLLFRHMKTLG
jgi:hypothetical protein